MCLWYNEKIDFETEKRLSKNGKILAWKVLERPFATKTLQSPYFCTEYKPGWNISNIKRKETRLRRKITNVGIHVFLKKSEAETLAKAYAPDARVVPVFCYSDDFVVGGWFSSKDSAVFRKVWMNEASYNRAMKRRT